MRTLSSLLFCAFIFHATICRSATLEANDAVTLNSVNKPLEIELGKAFQLKARLSCVQNREVSLDRRCWDPEAAPSGVSLVGVRRIDSSTFRSLPSEKKYDPAVNFPLGWKKGMPSSLHIVIPSNGSIEVIALDWKGFNTMSMVKGSPFSEPGDYEVSYVPLQESEPKVGSARFALSGCRFQVRIKRPATVLPLKELVHQGGQAWYAGLLLKAGEQSPELEELLSLPLDAKRREEIILAMSRFPANQRASMLMNVLRAPISDQEKAAVLQSARIGSPSECLPIFEKLAETTDGFDRSDGLLRAGAVNASMKIDRERGSQLAASVLGRLETKSKELNQVPEAIMEEMSQLRVRIKQNEKHSADGDAVVKNPSSNKSK